MFDLRFQPVVFIFKVLGIVYPIFGFVFQFADSQRFRMGGALLMVKVLRRCGVYQCQIVCLHFGKTIFCILVLKKVFGVFAEEGDILIAAGDNVVVLFRSAI